MWASRAEYTTTRPIATQFPTTKGSFDSKATWAIEMLNLFSWHVIYGCLYNQSLADVRSTGAGIKCLYWRMKTFVNKTLSMELRTVRV